MTAAAKIFFSFLLSIGVGACLPVGVELTMPDGGGVVALRGLPVPWFRTSVMGTGIDIAPLLFLFDIGLLWFAFYKIVKWVVIKIHVPRIVFNTLTVTTGCLIGYCFVLTVADPASATYSSVIWFPWDGWDGGSWAFG